MFKTIEYASLSSHEDANSHAIFLIFCLCLPTWHLWSTLDDIIGRRILEDNAQQSEYRNNFANTHWQR